MKKRMNRASIVLFVAAALFLFGDIPLMMYIRHLSTEVAAQYGQPMADELGIQNVWNGIRSALWGSGQLFGLGVLIELVDQIRCNALQGRQSA